MVNTKLDSGSFGTIFQCVDLEKPKHNYVIKISENYKILGVEIEALVDFRNQSKSSKYTYPYDYFPRCISKGMFLLDTSNPDEAQQKKDKNDTSDVSESSIEQNIRDGNKFMSFYVMNKYGHNLEEYYGELERFSKKTIYQVGIKMINCLERIHEAGYTYNDLKLDNILIGDHKSSYSSLHEIRLCDFGFAIRYIDKKTKKHFEPSEVEVFRSNMIFASVNQFDFKQTSRRDDMMSLCYFLVFMFNNGDVPFVAPSELTENKDVFKFIYKKKLNMTTQDLAKGIDSSGHFQNFLDHIFQLEFFDAPDYDFLEKNLVKCLHNIGEEYDYTFDWNKKWASSVNSEDIIYKKVLKNQENESTPTEK